MITLTWLCAIALVAVISYCSWGAFRAWKQAIRGQARDDHATAARIDATNDEDEGGPKAYLDTEIPMRALCIAAGALARAGYHETAVALLDIAEPF